MSEHHDEDGLPPSEVVVDTSGAEIKEHTVTVTPVSATPSAFTVVRKATYRAISWGLIGALIALALTQLAFWIDNRSKNEIIESATNSVEELTEDVRLLRQQLGDAQDQIKAASDIRSELETCRLRFNNGITQASQNYWQQFGDLLVVLGRRGEVPPDERESLEPVYQAIESTNLEWQAAIDARNAFEAAGAQLPCPLAQETGTG